MRRLLMSLVLCSAVKAAYNDPVVVQYSENPPRESGLQGRVHVIVTSERGWPLTKALIYDTGRKRQLAVNGSMRSLEAVVRSEFPEGVDSRFIEVGLTWLLSWHVDSDAGTGPMRTELRDKIMHGVENDPDLGAMVQRFDCEPMVRIKDNNWTVGVLTLNGENGLAYHLAKGELRPFCVKQIVQLVVHSNRAYFDKEQLRSGLAEVDRLKREHFASESH